MSELDPTPPRPSAHFETLAALASRLSAGDHVLASRALFGSTHQMLTRILNVPRFGGACSSV